MLRKSVKWTLIYVLEAVALLLALVIFGVGAVLWRLSSGPVELDFLRNDAQTMLAAAFDGDVVALGELEARFDSEDRALILVARDVAVAETTGEIVARAPLIETGLALDALVFGRLAPVEVTIVGGSVSVVRRADGAVGAGLGNVERVAADAQLPARGGDDSASLFQLLQEPAAINGPLGRLQRLRISNAAVRIVDDISGIAWFIDEAGVELDRDETRIQAQLEGRLATVSGFAPIAIRIEAGAALNSLLLEARVDQLSLPAIAPDNGPFAPLNALDAPLSLDLVVNAFRETGIQTASAELSIGAGQFMRVDDVLAFESADLSVGFDPIAGELIIHNGEIRSDVLNAAISGRLFNLDGYIGAFPTRWDYALEASPGRVDLDGVFEAPPEWDGIATRGDVDLMERRIGLDALNLDLAGLGVRLSGDLSLTEVEPGRFLPNIRLSGPVEGDVRPEVVLAHWPVALADGARDWVRDGIVSGRFYNSRLEMDIDAASIAAGELANERLTLSFDFEDAVVRYISTMSVIEEGVGRAVLRGNAFEVEMDSGRIGDIEILSGNVDMPRLNPKGAMATYSGRARGTAADILGLLDEEPLRLASNYGVDPQSIGGEGTFDFEIQRAMLTDVPPEDVLFAVNGVFEQVSIIIPGTDIALTDGVLELQGNQDQLTAIGASELLGAPVHIVWNEDFRVPDGEVSTEFTVEAALGPRALDQFGVPARRYLDGLVNIEAHAFSEGLDIRSVDLDIDLENAQLEAPGAVWVKPAGVPGSAGFTLSTNEAGNFVFDEVTASSAGLDLTASGEVAPGGRLVRLDLDRLHIEGLVDLQGRMAAPEEPGNPFTMRLNGPYLDATELVQNLDWLGGEDDGVPLSLTLDLGRLVVSDTGVFDDFSVIWRGEPEGVRAFSLAGRSVDGAFHANFGSVDEGGVREFRAEAQSIGRLAALIGQGERVVGGQISVLGEAPPLGVDGPLTARVEVRDVTLVQVPILARLLAAGSFEGLGALLNGEGISFDQIDADVMLENGLLTIGEARAAGSSLGVTASGTLDFEAQQAGIDGNLAPSYALNSLFGGVPIIGDLLVSRQGEGVIGITYSVSGPFDGLTVFANPLSALAPGLLRRIFEGTAAERAARERAEAQAQAQEATPQEPYAEQEPAGAPEPDEPDPDADPEDEPPQ